MKHTPDASNAKSEANPGWAQHLPNAEALKPVSRFSEAQDILKKLQADMAELVTLEQALGQAVSDNRKLTRSVNQMTQLVDRLEENSQTFEKSARKGLDKLLKSIFQSDPQAKATRFIQALDGSQEKTRADNRHSGPAQP